MMKMLSGDQGKDLGTNAGEYQRLEFSYDMSSTFMEDINDLEVALWIQDGETKEIYNSHYAYEYTEHCYPARNLNVVAKTVKWDAPEKGNPAGYNVYVDGKLVAEKISSLEYTSEWKNNRYVEVVAVYENDKTSVGIVKQITSEENVNEIETNDISVYPNPVDDKLYIETLTQTLTIEIYDVYGRLQDHKTTRLQGCIAVDVVNLNSGIYFVKVVTENGNVVKRIVKY
jgi:hypothetical protein